MQLSCKLLCAIIVQVIVCSYFTSYCVQLLCKLLFAVILQVVVCNYCASYCVQLVCKLLCANIVQAITYSYFTSYYGQLLCKLLCAVILQVIVCNYCASYCVQLVCKLLCATFVQVNDYGHTIAYNRCKLFDSAIYRNWLWWYTYLSSFLLFQMAFSSSFREYNTTTVATTITTWTATVGCKVLECHVTHWGRDKMTAISQTTFSNVFYSMKLLEFARIKISLTFASKGPINYIPAVIPIMAWRRPGDKSLSEPMVVSLPTHTCVTRPQWDNVK